MNTGILPYVPLWEVLSYLDATSVDNCRATCVPLYQVVTTDRLKLKQHHIIDVMIEDEGVYHSFRATKNNNVCSNGFIVRKGDGIPYSILNVLTNTLFFRGENFPEGLDKKWMSKISSVVIKEVTEESQVMKILEQTNCSDLDIEVKVSMPLGNILARMRFVEKLKMVVTGASDDIFSPSSFEELATKTHGGSGIERLEIQNDEDPIDPRAFIKFIEKAKYADCYGGTQVIINYIRGTSEDFSHMLKQLMITHKDWKIHSGNYRRGNFVHFPNSNKSVKIYVSRFSQNIQQEILIDIWE